MQHNDLISGVIIEESESLTLEEFCRATHVAPKIVIEMIEYQLIKPMGKTQAQWRFDAVSLKRGRLAGSFYHELEINMPGVALALDLLDRIEQLEQQVKDSKDG